METKNNNQTLIFVILGFIIIACCCITVSILCLVSGIFGNLYNSNKQNSNDFVFPEITQQPSEFELESSKKLMDKNISSLDAHLKMSEDIITKGSASKLFKYEQAEVNIDDDPILGDLIEAKLVMVEFGDYECPFCIKHHTQVHDKLVSTFVDYDDLAIVFRDYPLPTHNPAAEDEAAFAECVGELSNDGNYFKFQKEIFTKTLGNGSGLNINEILKIAKSLGVDDSKLMSCAYTTETLNEINSDIVDGNAAGVSGTPSFIIGYLFSDGTVKGVRIDGAYPFEDFKTVIDTLKSFL